MDIFDKPLSAEEKEFILAEIEASVCKISEACKSKLVKEFVEYLKRDDEALRVMFPREKINELKVNFKHGTNNENL